MKTFIYAAMLAVTLSGCSTLGETTAEIEREQAIDKEEIVSILGILAIKPTALVNAEDAGSMLQAAYVGEIGKVEKTRRNFNIAGIMSQTYSVIGAGLQVHPHNLIISTALTSAIPVMSTQFAPPEVENAIVTASASTSCVQLSLSPALDSATLSKVRFLRKAEDSDEARQTLERYNSLGKLAMAHYSRAYQNYVVARVPPVLDGDALRENIQKAEEDEKDSEPKPDIQTVDNPIDSSGLNASGLGGDNGFLKFNELDTGARVQLMMNSGAKIGTDRNMVDILRKSGLNTIDMVKVAETNAKLTSEIEKASAYVNKAADDVRANMAKCFTTAAPKPAVLAAAPVAGTTAATAKPKT